LNNGGSYRTAKSNSRCGVCEQPIELLTGDQSRLLKVGDRVGWGATTTDLGTVVETTWNGIAIDWDDGNRTSIQHNDMAQVERVPVKLA
jgi:hypothetical protein